MSFNGSGVYTAPGADFPAVASTLIEATKFNNIINDMATALSTTICKDGQQTLTANIPFGGYYATSGGLRAMAGSVGTPSISFIDDTDCGLYRIGANNLGLALNGAKVLDFSTTGVAFTALCDLSGAAAGQVKFPATQNASTNANTLDDYEEGTWTPIVGGTATYTTQNGSYIKIGKRVVAHFELTINAIGSGSTTAISGLPFTSAATYYGSAIISFFATLTTNVVFLGGYVAPSGTAIDLTVLTAAGATTSTVTSVIQGGTRIIGTAVYEASA